jgi:hypothetical protein
MKVTPRCAVATNDAKFAKVEDDHEVADRLRVRAEVWRRKEALQSAKNAKKSRKSVDI